MSKTADELRARNREANEYARTFNKIALMHGHDLPMALLGELIALFDMALAPSVDKPTASAEIVSPQNTKPEVSYSAPLKFDGSDVARSPEPATSDFSLCSRHGRMACQECRREGYSVHISNLSKTQIECVFCKDRGILPSEAIACFAHSEGYIRDVLLAHWPLLQCDHEAKTDTAICACGERIEPQPSVQRAIEAWVNHLFGEVHDHAAALRYVPTYTGIYPDIDRLIRDTAREVIERGFHGGKAKREREVEAAIRTVLAAVAPKRCGTGDKRGRPCVLAPGHYGRHQDAWGMKFPGLKPRE